MRRRAHCERQLAESQRSHASTAPTSDDRIAAALNNLFGGTATWCPPNTCFYLLRQLNGQGGVQVVKDVATATRISQDLFICQVPPGVSAFIFINFNRLNLLDIF